MSELLKRALTGIVFVIILIGGIYFKYSFGILFLIITLLGVNEFYNLSRIAGASVNKFQGFILTFLFFTINYLIAAFHIPFMMLTYIIPFIFLLFINELFQLKSKPFLNISFTLLGFVYVVIPFSCLIYIAMPDFLTHDYHNYNSSILLGSFFILWCNDTGAYIVGKYLGKTKLFPVISPKKTWEGSLGGLFFGLVMAFCNSLWFSYLDIYQWLIVGAIVVVFGSLGDLVESQFKRSIKIKDSGNILPGHGGILDRFDGLLIAAPFILFYLILISKF